MSTDSEGGNLFIGRADALQALRAALGAAVRGRGGLVLLAGEAGIGKTRLVEEATDGARRDLVAWGRCDQNERASALFPWVQALDAIAAGLDTPSLRRMLGEGGSLLAALLPSLNEPAGAPPAPLPDSREARFLLFDEVARFLDGAGRRAPLTVALDDLHHADPLSLSLLQFVARQLRHMPVAVIATHRPASRAGDHPLTQCLVELARVPGIERIELGGLSRREVSDLVARGSGVEPPASVADAIHEQTGGSPALVAELVRELLTDRRWSPAASEDGWRVTLRPGLRRMAQTRLASLSDACRHVLRVAAVVGTIFADEVMEAVVSTMAPAAVAALESPRSLNSTAESLAEAEAAGIVVADPGEGRHRFAQAQTRDILYDEIPADIRAETHWQAGSALEMLGAHGDVETEIAYHYFTAVRTTAADQMRVARAVEYAERAARNALGASDYGEAARLYRIALGSLEHCRPVDERRRAALRLAVADASERAEQADRARAAEASREAVSSNEDENAKGHEASSAEHSAEPAGVNSFQRQGDYWVIRYAGRSIRLKHGRGLEYLAYLLRHPGREILALDVVDVVPNRRAAALSSPSAGGDASSAPDATAKAAYRRRIADLREALGEAERDNDLGAADRLGAELVFVTEELTRSVGLGGRQRSAPADLERARSAVGKRIKADIRRIEAVDPHLGSYLSATVSTGYFCSYRPAASAAGWDVC